MHAVPTAHPEVKLIEAEILRDARGVFVETYQQRKFAELGITNAFVQDNYSRSMRGTLRGLHYQLAHPQAKLCRVLRGEVLDVAVDVRRGSPSFGKWVSARLSGRNMRQIFVPAGFAHGFMVMSAEAEFFYKCDDFYFPDDQYGIRWNDPILEIEWGIADPLLSERDRELPGLADLPESSLPAYRP